MGERGLDEAIDLDIAAELGERMDRLAVQDDPWSMPNYRQRVEAALRALEGSDQCCCDQVRRALEGQAP